MLDENKEFSAGRKLANAFSASMLCGLLVFYLLDGFVLLADDVGTAGALGISIVFQLVYSTLIVIGFGIYLLFSYRIKMLAPTHLSTAFSSSLVSLTINVYGHIREGPGVDFIIVALMVVGGALILFLASSLIFNCIIGTERGK